MIGREDLERLDERYILRAECGRISDAKSEEISQVHENLAVLIAKTSMTLNILKAIGVGILGIVIELLFK